MALPRDRAAALAAASPALATCTSRGVPPAAAGCDPATELTLAACGAELRLHVRHCAYRSVHTGGHIWSCARHLARWLFARRELLDGVRLLELGCGLALPSLVAARCGAEVCATDELDALIEHATANARASGCTIAARRLDFTRRTDVLSLAGAEAPWDVVAFADIVYSGEGGECLPHALADLLRRQPGAIAVGVFPPDLRAGTDVFWAQAAAAGLSWDESVYTPDEDARSGRLYVFRAARARGWEGWGEGRDEPLVLPLFSDVEDEECRQAG